MAIKERKTYNLDSGVVKAFEQIAKKKGKKYSELLEELLEQFIAKDGELFADEIYAPRLQYAINQAVKNETNRLASMIYKNHVETTSALIGVPYLYKKIQEGFEKGMRTHINTELLNPLKGTDPDNPNEVDFLYKQINTNKTVNELRKNGKEEYHENKRKEKDLENKRKQQEAQKQQEGAAK